MTISATGKKCVVLGLAICLVLSSFHEVSCQVEGSFEGQRVQSNVESLEAEETSSVSRSVESESEAASSQVGRRSSSSDVRRLAQGLSDGDINSDAELMDASEFGATNWNRAKEMEELQGRVKATASGKSVVEEEYTKESSKVETSETAFQGRESTEGETDRNQIYYGNEGANESEGYMINEPIKIGSEAGSTESRLGYESKKTNARSGFAESLRIGQSGSWTCTNQDQNGARGDDSIIIPKYELNDIMNEESIKGSSSKTSSLMTSLSKIVETHKEGRWQDVKIGKVTTKETSVKVTRLRETLKRYVGIKVRELVARSDYENILTMAAHYEELTLAPVTYISKLATFGTVIKQGFKVSQRVKTVHQSVMVHEKVAIEKQKRVDAEFELVKTLADKGDKLSVKIFAMKKMVLRLEAEKREVDIEFKKIVENLSHVLEESSKAYEKHHGVVREWKEAKAHVEYSHETIEKAEVVWVQFLSTL
ncbi:unnamed protein product [Thlaspi arvense]|uniref:NAI2-like protein n=1 Tax=Thlaspi arvense TaxID=13288 RepID=A0AAU9S9F0_THLAR|nr:unnamed protein product [Thlaspi arvense]